MTWQRGLVSISRAVEELNLGLIERKREVYLSMVALVARQHLFLLGPPGTGKSFVARKVGQATGGPFYEILLTKFTTPDEVFGPISVKGLIERETYERKVEGYLPTARVAFTDEIWKASSAILNNLLTIINERVFDNGGRRITVPLDTVIAASNELPEDDTLSALYDRFLLRHEVAPVSNPIQLLSPLPDVSPKIEPAHLADVQEAARHVMLPSNVQGAMVALKGVLAKKGIEIGDRRFQQSARLVQATALLDGGKMVAGPEHLRILTACYWETPDQIPAVETEVMRAIGPGIPLSSGQRSAPAPSRTPAGPSALAQAIAGEPMATTVNLAMRGMNQGALDLLRDHSLHLRIDKMLTQPQVTESATPIKNIIDQAQNWKTSIQGHIANTPGASWGPP